ncbi:putative CMGC/CDK/CDK5 protein kinase [Paramicrosporidium saccamoebae]|uniref:Putative CMGC/CDK/CDK5 protein kinase n=1 Tax=Paramicrosporidium saccamoebae TaxID=1246581 RepID=A0A2H9TGL1_9FUNG|nr:putative CMGC/CDK/CDK5 protein kinase [Paramicrosporidium saccamoebae]
MEKYTKLQKIGEGTYAHVYRARNNLTGEQVALKEITLNHDEGAPSTALREIAFMKELRHDNIVRLLEVIHTETQLVLVFECLQQDLKQFLDLRRSAQRPLQPTEVKSLLYQLIDAVRHCHEHRVLHRDLKPQNLLLDQQGTILKVADFGLARGFGIPVAGFSHEVVTLWYRAPDVLLGSTVYSTPIDMWSIGCIMAELYFVGSPLFPGKNTQDQLKKIFKLLGTPRRDEWSSLLAPNHPPPDWLRTIPLYPKPASLSTLFPMIEPSGLDLLSHLLDYRPSFRIHAQDALAHPYFYKVAPNFAGEESPTSTFHR